MHKLLEQQSAVMLGVYSGVTAAISTLLANYIVRSVIVGPDANLSALVYVTLGGWILVVWGVIFFLTDPQKSFSLLEIPHLKFGFLSAFFTAAAVFCNLKGHQVADPSVIQQLENVAIVWIVFFQLLSRTISLKLVLIPTLLTLLGALFSSADKEYNLTLEAAAWVFVAQGILQAFGNIYLNKGGEIGKATSYLLTRYVFFALSASVLLTLYDSSFHLEGALLETLLTALQPASLLAVSAAMLSGYLYIYCFLLASLKVKGSTITHASIIKQNCQVGLVVVITFVISTVSLYVFHQETYMFGTTAPWYIWIARAIGLAISFYAVTKLKLTTESTVTKNPRNIAQSPPA